VGGAHTTRSVGVPGRDGETMGNGSGRRAGLYTARGRMARGIALAVVVLAGMLLLSPVGPAEAGGVAAPSKVRLGHTPRIPAGASAVSALPATTALKVDVVLQPRDPAALTSYAQAVSTPGSGQYRRYLSERQFVNRFGPTGAAVKSVRHALVSAGLHPGTVSTNDLSIPVEATAGQLASAFATGFEQYRVGGGRTAYANTTAPLVSSSVAPLVQTVVGLDDLSLAQPGSRPGTAAGTLAKPAPQVATGGPQPCTTAVDDASADDAYTSDVVASAYGFSSFYGQGDLGSGQTVALYELQGYGSSDIVAYQSCFGTSTPVSTVNVDGGPLAHAGVGEADVDIEQVLSFAPDARILVYEGPNSATGGYDTYNTIIADDAATVVSTSWGLCEPFTGSATAEAEDTLFEEAATQGQSVVAASGDEGSEDCLGTGYSNDTLAVDDPASQPFVTGAGGTSWTALGATPTESAWNDGPTCCWGAGGGGVSEQWPMPSYQTGAAGIGTVNAGSSGTPCLAAAGSYCREVPDVSALAGPYPYLEYVSGSWGSWGGTSLAAPLWASLLALSNASQACAGKDIGFANPVLYGAAEAQPTAFNDVTVGDNDLTGRNGGVFPALSGYDMATGLGTPNAAALPALLCAGAPAAQVTVTNPGNQATYLGSAVRLAIQAVDTTEGQTLTYSTVGLPSGLTINSTSGVISGTPTTPGPYLVLVKAQAGNGASGSAGFLWSVNVIFTTPASATAVVGKPFSFTVATTGVPKSIKETPKLPKGLKFHNAGNGTATLSGTPSTKDALKTYPLAIKATFGKGKSAVVLTQAFSLTLT
jgi:subtilase family serine protease